MSRLPAHADAGPSAASDLELTKPELNTRVVRSLVLYFESKYSTGALNKILAETGLDRAYLADEHNWVSMAYRDRLIQAMTERSGDPQFAYRAGRFTATKEAIGIGYAVLASFSTPRTLYSKMMELAGEVNKVGHFTVLELTRSSLTCVYQPVSDEYWDEGPGAEFRLGQLVAWPRLCGLPDATYEGKIVDVEGRRAYHYVFRWEQPRWSYEPLVGAMAGALIGVGGYDLVRGASVLALILAAVLGGVLVGLLVSSHKQNKRLLASIARQQDSLYESDRALQHRYDELYENHIEITQLNEELEEKVKALEGASQEIHRLNEALEARVRELEVANAELNELKGSLQQKVDEQVLDLNAKNEELSRINAMLDQQAAALNEKNRELEEKNSKLDQQKEALNSKNRELLATTNQLREMDQVKTRFFARVNHELRTPLTLILPPLDAILGDTYQPVASPHRQLLQTMRMNAFRLLKLINGLLDLAKGGAGKIRLRYTPLDLNQLLLTVLEEVKGSMERHGLRLETDLEEGLEPVWADAEKLETVVLNLVSNAVKFTPSGGCIRVFSSASDTEVRIDVSDTGPGIAPDRLPRIFDHFADGGTEVERGYGGTGIGLSMVREFTQLHNGEVEVSSTLGEGTTFTIRLPLGQATIRPEVRERRHQKRDVPVSRRKEEGKQPVVSEYFSNAHEINMSEFRGLEYHRVLEDLPKVPGRQTVLIIDDNHDMLFLLTGLLRNEYNIITANNGEIGEEMARKQLPDLVLSDVMMTGKDGFKLCADLKKHPETKDIPVVLMSARSKAADGLEIGADDYLTKPFNILELRARIRAHLERRDLMNRLVKTNRELEAQKAIVEEMARTDNLTRLYNRHYMEEISLKAYEDARSTGQELSCFMMDIDHFKAFNTRFGHAGGDEVLKEFGRALSDWFGDKGTAARHGGEEFVVLLPDFSLTESSKLARAFREYVHDSRFGADGQYEITVSIGVASYPANQADNYEALLQVADEALYLAKRRRDCVVVAQFGPIDEGVGEER